MKWISVYIFYEEPLDNFLSEALVPFTAQLSSKTLFDKYFFIRYWEKGTHIRLRIRTKQEKDTIELIENFFTGYFCCYPSQRDERRFESTACFKNNSLQYVKYEPETERYGGSAGLEICEGQFLSSSKAVLGLLKENPAIEYSSKITAAIQMHFAFLMNCGLGENEIAGLFMIISKRMQYHVLNFAENEDKQTIEKKRSKLTNSFENARKAQKEQLLKLIGILVSAFEENSVFEEAWMNIFINESKSFGRMFRDILNRGLVVPQWYSATDKLWYIYESLIHMTNNRLGITNSDEAYLAYLIYKTIQETNE